MAATPAPFSTKDSASGQLNAGISAAATSIVLQSGNGAAFPQPYNGTCTSAGSATTLNCTGISATIGGSAQEGKWLWNKTDGSVARIITGGVATNAVTTTRLLGGTTNVWNSSDIWCLDPFVATLAVVVSGAVTTSEEVLIIGRSTDTLTVATGGRGYNGTTASSFSTNDYCYLFVTSPIVERLKDILSVINQQVDTNVTSINTANTNITNLQTGTYHYVVTSGSANAYVAATPALAAYAAGNLVVFNANFTNTGSATLNLNSLGAKTIKKGDGATNLASGDIASGQLVVVRYDGTNFQMLSPTAATVTTTVKTVYVSGTSSTGLTNPTSDTSFDTHTYSVSANDIVSGVAYEFECALSSTTAAGNLQLSVQLGSTVIARATYAPSAASNNNIFRGTIYGTAAAGASVAVRGVSLVMDNDASGGPKSGGGYGSANVATNGTLTLQFAAKFGTSNGGNVAQMLAATITKLSTTPFT